MDLIKIFINMTADQLEHPFFENWACQNFPRRKEAERIYTNFTIEIYLNIFTKALFFNYLYKKTFSEFYQKFMQNIEKLY